MGVWVSVASTKPNRFPYLSFAGRSRKGLQEIQCSSFTGQQSAGRADELADGIVCLGAAAIATLLTAVLMPMPGADTFRDVAGFLTSLVAFTAIVATFTSGAWIITVILAAVWVLAIRLQSLGDIETR